MDTSAPLQGVAIIGMSGRFPGAPDVATLWANLCAGRETVRQFTDDELLAAGADPARLRDPAFVRARGVLDGVEEFDAAFFGMPPREADLTDPQQRLFLECAWEAFEDAGHRPGPELGPVGVFAGSSLNTYFLTQVLRGAGANARFAQGFQVDDYPTLVGCDKDYLATRVAYRLNLRGPALTVQTACSTSLVAVCQACASLTAFQCDVAVAGGVSISFPQARGYLYQEGAIASADGRCRAFDAGANGTVFGAGCGVVLLKRLEDALRDRDHIYAVIRGAALNNDGGGKSSYSAPSVDGQAEVIALAHALAEVPPDSISYIEAHGTGTPLGDPIEVAALTRAFRAGTRRTGFCGLGSVKTNLGHLEAAAGVTGLIKTALALQHRVLPPTLHFREPNPNIDFAGSPFRVVAELTPWTDAPLPRRAGVSSFGVGGTNAHVVLEEAPELEPDVVRGDHVLIPLSARSAGALTQSAERLAAWIEAAPADGTGISRLASMAHTLQVGRVRFEHRRCVVAATAAEAVTRLRTAQPGVVVPREGPAAITFAFPGQGSQHPGMGRSLHAQEPVYQEAFDLCADGFAPLIGTDLRTLVLPPAGEEDSAAENLRETRFAQPALFAVGYALARLWQSWGLQPSALVGHSIGEYVAAVLAGVLELPAALDIVAARGRLMQSAPRGAMLGVRASEAELQAHLPPGIVIAAVNAPNSVVAAGSEAAITALRATLEAAGIAARPLVTSHAFHSPLMDGVVEPFAEVIARHPLAPPRIPIVSTRTGTWMTPDEAVSPAYWSRQIRDPVRFADAVETLRKTSPGLLLEVGPGQVLSRLTQGQTRPADGLAAVPSLPPAGTDTPERPVLLEALGRLWCAGHEPDWSAVHAGEDLRRVPLPPYPFERRRHWIEPSISTPASAAPEQAPASVTDPAPAPVAARSLSGLPAEGNLEDILLRQLEIMSAQLSTAAGVAPSPDAATIPGPQPT